MCACVCVYNHAADRSVAEASSDCFKDVQKDVVMCRSKPTVDWQAGMQALTRCGDLRSDIEAPKTFAFSHRAVTLLAISLRPEI